MKVMRAIVTAASIPSNTPKWNTTLRLLANKSQFSEALSVYLQMLRSGAFPNAFTFPFALKSCAALSLPFTGTQIYCHVIKTGCLLEPFVQTSLISMYSKCGFITYAHKVFDENPYRLSVCYNALIAGYASSGYVRETVGLFCEMRELGLEICSVTLLCLVPACGVPGNMGFGMSVHGVCVKFGLDFDSSVANSLLTMYAKCGETGCARKLFNQIPEKEVISWNAMINGYAQNGLANKVLELYKTMELSGFRPDPVTLVGVLSSCANLGAHTFGKRVEQRMEASGFGKNPFLNNALINMYSRCGNLVKAREIFERMPVKSVVSWTAIIGGYGMHGKGSIAVELFDDMIRSGIIPDGAAFVSVLCACSHAGLTDQGLDYFNTMEKKYGLQPGPEHYSCMVDLFGRAGRLNEAHELIKSMRVKPDGAVWGALLGACKIHKNVELAELAFERVIELEPTNIGYYVLLSNIYSNAKNTDGILRIRTMMRERKLKKDPGCSYVEFGGKLHLFFSGDKDHPQADEIHRMVNELEVLVKKVDQSERSDEERSNIEPLSGLGVHSEKLAVAFGILNTKQGAEIVIIKNLRICGDCHFFIKSVSKFVDRRFIVRDPTRFHHFEKGLCSCTDYW